MTFIHGLTDFLIAFPDQMHFPIEDVVKNVRAFVSSVKRATGNKEASEIKKKDTKPGMSLQSSLVQALPTSIQLSLPHAFCSAPCKGLA
jgi:hypothetical protein